MKEIAQPPVLKAISRRDVESSICHLGFGEVSHARAVLSGERVFEPKLGWRRGAYGGPLVWA